MLTYNRYHDICTFLERRTAENSLENVALSSFMAKVEMQSLGIHCNSWQSPFHMQVRVATVRRGMGNLLPFGSSRARIAYAETCDSSELDFERINGLRGQLFVERSNKFFRYKQCNDNSLMRFRSGLAWLSIRADGLFVGNFWPSSDGKALWQDIQDQARTLGLRRVYYHTTPNLPAYDIAGKLANGLPVIVKTLGRQDLEPRSIALTGADYDTF
jgi:hypothetical protein